MRDLTMIGDLIVIAACALAGFFLGGSLAGGRAAIAGLVFGSLLGWALTRLIKD